MQPTIQRNLSRPARTSEASALLFGQIHAPQPRAIDWTMVSAMPVQSAGDSLRLAPVAAEVIRKCSLYHRAIARSSLLWSDKPRCIYRHRRAHDCHTINVGYQCASCAYSLKRFVDLSKVQRCPERWRNSQLADRAPCRDDSSQRLADGRSGASVSAVGRRATQAPCAQMSRHLGRTNRLGAATLVSATGAAPLRSDYPIFEFGAIRSERQYLRSIVVSRGAWWHDRQ